MFEADQKGVKKKNPKQLVKNNGNEIKGQVNLR